MHPLTVAVVARREGRASNQQAMPASVVVRDGLGGVMPLRPASKLQGKVTDPAGNPVADALVVYGQKFLLANFHLIGFAVTDAEGNYLIDDIPKHDAAAERKRLQAEREASIADSGFHLTVAPDTPEGTAPLEVRHPEFALKRVGVKQVPSTVDVQLEPAAVIRGRVVYAKEENGQQKPAADRIVKLIAPPRVIGLRQITVRTDNDGRYHFGSLPRGVYAITAVSDEWMTRGIDGVTVGTAEAVTAPVLELTRGELIPLQFVDDATNKPFDAGRPVQVAIVAYPGRNIGMKLPIRKQVTISRDGTAEARLPRGEYELYVDFIEREANQWTLAPSRDAKKRNYRVTAPLQKSQAVELRVAKRPAAAAPPYTDDKLNRNPATPDSYPMSSSSLDELPRDESLYLDMREDPFADGIGP